MHKCPYCGSNLLQTMGGENGNPFERCPEKTICLDCGRTIHESIPNSTRIMSDFSAAGRMKDELEKAQAKKSTVVIEMTARAAGITRFEKAVIPYKDGEYSLYDYQYPISRFGSVVIRGDTFELDGEVSKLTDQVLETTKHYTAYAPDKHPEQETIKIKIYTEKNNE